MTGPGGPEMIAFALFGLLPLVVAVGITVWVLILLARISRSTDRIASAVERLAADRPVGGPPPGL